MVSSKGYSVTTNYSTLLLADSSRRSMAIQNTTLGSLYITVGGSQSDSNAFVIPAGGFYEPAVAPGGTISVRSTVPGYVVVLGDNLP